MAPLHHHFELKGWTETKVIVRFWIIADRSGAAGHEHIEAAVNGMRPVRPFPFRATALLRSRAGRAGSHGSS